MAIYHVNHKSIGRSTHAEGTAGAHVSYITRATACDLVIGEHMPIPRVGSKGGEARRWLDDQEQNDRKNARVIDKLTLALPHELTPEQQVELVRNFAASVTGGEAPYLAAFHRSGKDAENQHCHLVLRDRHIETGKRVWGRSGKGLTEELREKWERCTNVALGEAENDTRIDRRSLKAQRAEMLEMEKSHRTYQPELADEFAARAETLDRKPQGHEGPKSREIERKGRKSHKLDRIREARRGPQSGAEARRAPEAPQTRPSPPEAYRTSLRAVFEEIISPEGWGERLWNILEHWGLVRASITREEVANDLLVEGVRETALSLFALRDQPTRLKILDDLGQPHELDTGDAKKADMLSGLSPTTHEPKPHPDRTVSPPSRQDAPRVQPEPEKPKPQAPRRKSGWDGPSGP